MTLFALALTHALLFALAFPPYDLWPFSFLAIAPLVAIALRADRPIRAAGVVWLTTLPMWLVLEHWLVGVTAIGYVLVSMYLALYPAAFVWIAARLAPKVRSNWLLALLLAAVWIGLETLRGEVVFTGYAWFLIAHPLIDTLFAQLASEVGVSGVGFFVVFVQALTLLSFMRRSRRWKAAIKLTSASVLCITVGAAGVGLYVRMEVREYIPSDVSGKITIAVVQTNVPQSNKTGWTIEQRLKDFERFRELTLEAADVSVDQQDDGRDAHPTEHVDIDGKDARPTMQGEADGRDARPTDRTTNYAKPDLIVWPETMFPGETLSPAAVEEERRVGLVYEGGVPAAELYDRMLELQREVATPMLVGSIGYDDLRVSPGVAGGVEFHDTGKYNSVFLIEDGAVSSTRYDKIHLTPFGEVMPYISWSDRLERWLLSLGAPGMAFDLDAGKTPTVIEVPFPKPYKMDETPEPSDYLAMRVVTPICFEAATPGVCRRLVFKNGVRQADLMVNLTNDGWFGDSVAGHLQHLQVARWRCIELRTPMVRAANTGASAFINTLGEIQLLGPKDRKQSVNVDGVLAATVWTSYWDSTLYARWGDVTGWFSLFVAAGALGATFLRKPSRQTPTPSEPKENQGTPPCSTPEK